MSSSACTQRHHIHAAPQFSSKSCADDALARVKRDLVSVKRDLGIQVDIRRHQYVVSLQHKCTIALTLCTL